MAFSLIHFQPQKGNGMMAASSTCQVSQLIPAGG